MRDYLRGSGSTTSTRSWSVTSSTSLTTTRTNNNNTTTRTRRTARTPATARTASPTARLPNRRRPMAAIRAGGSGSRRPTPLTASTRVALTATVTEPCQFVHSSLCVLFDAALRLYCTDDRCPLDLAKFGAVPPYVCRGDAVWDVSLLGSFVSRTSNVLCVDAPRGDGVELWLCCSRLSYLGYLGVVFFMDLCYCR